MNRAAIIQNAVKQRGTKLKISTKELDSDDSKAFAAKLITSVMKKRGK